MTIQGNALEFHAIDVYIKTGQKVTVHRHMCSEYMGDIVRNICIEPWVP